MALLTITREDGTELIKVRVPDTGKEVREIEAYLRSRGFAGTLMADGIGLTASDLVTPADKVTFLPDAVIRGDSSALPFIQTPVFQRPAKRQKIAALKIVTRRASIPDLVGTGDVGVLASLNWLGLHLSEEASVNLATFLGTTHEKRYYPYVLAVVKAAAAASIQGRVEIVGEDKNKSQVPDVQVIVDGGKEIIPMDVKKEWGHGSVDDPDGIGRNIDDLEQLLKYVLTYNAHRAADYTCMTAVIIRVQHMLFLKFRIRKASAQDLGSLELLEYAPAFPRQGAGQAAVAGLSEVRIINMERLINSHFALNSRWSDQPVENMDLPGTLVERIRRTSFQELLPANSPQGFEALVKYFRAVAPDCYDPLQFVYDSRDGCVEAAGVLASGRKSCVIATVGGSSVLKVSSKSYIDLDLGAHRLAGHECPFLRKMVAYGHVEGAAAELMFIELEGLGISWSSKHVEAVHKCWVEASTAVRALHAKEVFHRDIKPSNFIVFDHGMESQRLVLNDLDCAASWDMSMTGSVGTPMFQSPLLDAAEEYRCRDDWLSLGLSFANLMGLYSRVSNSQGKLTVLRKLLTHTHIPEDMKETIGLALRSKHVCCHRVRTCRVAEYYGDRMVTESCDECYSSQESCLLSIHTDPTSVFLVS